MALSDGICSTDIIVIRSRHGQIDPAFLSQYLISPAVLTQVTSAAAGANLPRISPEALLDILVPVPSLAEQERIVKLIDEADELRKLRAQADDLTKALIPALFTEMFGDTAVNFLGWPTANLGRSCKFIGGSSLPTGEAFAGQPDGLLLLKVGDMNEDGNETFIVRSREWLRETSSHSRCPKGAVIFPKRGAAIATNKKRMLLRDALLDPNLMGVYSTKPDLLGEYLYEWLRLFDLTRITSGSTVPQLNKQDLAPLEIPIPPLKL